MKTFYVEVSALYAIRAETPQDAAMIVQQRTRAPETEEVLVFDNVECAGDPLYKENA